ncbi:hypothetical protein THAOC_08990 [Thalassiosira oceanica]|uniref:Uncharacterized protein n=1 Tax=Thalassiosira oceanica TaxID=159749 RepID=K0SXQ6_THAOC|nr:hypothetical protein THAOC_08990 [Thalassiosira oceanica]|eukprot:EJK69724.1 hypothetical protein THAOC_08990 [Thalassiosira oceanica]
MDSLQSTMKDLLSDKFSGRSCPSQDCQGRVHSCASGFTPIEMFRHLCQIQRKMDLIACADPRCVQRRMTRRLDGTITISWRMSSGRFSTEEQAPPSLLP